MKKHILIFLMFSGIASLAQNSAELNEQRVGPGIRNGRPGRAAELSYYTALRPFDIYSRPQLAEISRDTFTVNDLSRLTVKFKIPIVNKDYNKVVFGFKHVKEEFNLHQDPAPADYMQNLNNRPLKSISGAIYTSHYLANRRFITTKAELSFNGDYNNHQLNFSQVYKLNVSLVYGISKSDDLVYGFGLYYSQRMGRRNAYPVLLFQKNYSDRFAIISTFPANVNLQYRPAPRAYITTGYELQGANYTLRYDSPPVEQFTIGELRINEVDVPLKYEQCVYDFLWFELAVGYTWFFTYRVDHKLKSGNVPVVRHRTPGFVFGEASVFLTVPRKFRNKTTE